MSYTIWKSNGKPGRLLLAAMYIWIAGLAAFGLLVESLVGQFLFFTHGWANGWPFGLSLETVLSVGVTGYVLLELITATTGVGATIGLICICLRVEEEYESLIYRRWPWVVFVLLCIASSWAS
jgi:hypothetical protein